MPCDQQALCMKNIIVMLLLHSCHLATAHVFLTLLNWSCWMFWIITISWWMFCAVRMWFGAPISMIWMFCIVRTCFDTPTPFSPSHNKTKHLLMHAILKPIFSVFCSIMRKVAWLCLSRHQSFVKTLVFVLTWMCSKWRLGWIDVTAKNSEKIKHTT